MTILTNADAPTIRGRLGDLADDMTDAELLAPFIVRPVEAAVLRQYPDIATNSDSRLALSLMVAAAHLRSMPQETSSRLGDSQVQYAAGEWLRMADMWEQIAWETIKPAEPDGEPAFGFLFGRIPGRR